MKKTTEQDSLYTDLEHLSTSEIVHAINEEDKKVAFAVEKKLAEIEQFVEAVYPKMKEGGRLIYAGAGTSGRLGILDASEIPPTFGMEFGRVLGIMAGGDIAITRSQENVEDHTEQAVKDLMNVHLNEMDSLLGITASGSTPYVLAGCRYANSLGCVTGGLTMNEGSPLSQTAKFPIEVVVGAEFLTGSTRMKSGTAQKMVLNMISTTLMIKLGRVKGNKMSHMQLSNIKLRERGVRILMEQYQVSRETAERAVSSHKTLEDAVKSISTHQKG